MSVIPATIATQAATWYSRSDWGAAGAMTTGALVVAGAEDVLTRPQGMEEIAALIPGAEYRLIPKSGHMIPVEQPEQLDALLTQEGVNHTFETYEGDHNSKVPVRFDTRVLPFFSNQLAIKGGK